MRKSTAVASKSAERGRIEARIPLDLKEKLERAAALKGLNLSSFVVRSMERISEEIIAEHEHRQLSRQDQEAFFEALLNPPEPNEKMKAAALRFHGL